MPLSRQEIFDRAVCGLIAQGKPAYGPSDYPSCAYRTDDGLKCGIGMLITSVNYSSELEGRIASDRAVRKAADIGEENAEFAERVQKLHDQLMSEDQSTFVPIFYWSAYTFAQYNSLELNEICAAYDAWKATRGETND